MTAEFSSLIEQARNLMRGGYSYGYALDFLHRERGFDALAALDSLASLVAEREAELDALGRGRTGWPEVAALEGELKCARAGLLDCAKDVREAEGRIAAYREVIDALTDEIEPGYGTLMQSLAYYCGPNSRTAVGRSTSNAYVRLRKAIAALADAPVTGSQGERYKECINESLACQNRPDSVGVGLNPPASEHTDRADNSQAERIAELEQALAALAEHVLVYGNVSKTEFNRIARSVSAGHAGDETE